MKVSIRLIPAAALALSLPAVAQGPVLVTFSPGYSAQDVTVIDGDVVVVGMTDAFDVFRWTLSSNIEAGLGVAVGGGNISVSDDGTKISAMTLNQLDQIDRASRWVLGSGWTQLPGLAAISGTSESTPYDISGDGETVVGLGWATPGAGHCYRWNATTGVQDLGGPHNDPSSRANATNLDGTVLVGWKDLLNGLRQGAYWVNGVLQPQLTWVNPANMVSYRLGEALATNSSGTTIVGFRVYNAPAGFGEHAWRWDAGLGTRLLPSLPGSAAQAIPTGVTDDGQIVVGNAGGTAVIWVNDVPQTLNSYLNALGWSGPCLGSVSAIDRLGRAICGGNWVVIFPSAIEVGTPSCVGDGAATACPCGNNSAPGAEEGCLNSFGQGAKLTATGGTSLTADTVVLNGRQMPNAPALYFQGTGLINNGQGAAFGDGLRCAGGALVRLKQITNAGGMSQYPEAGDPPVSVRGMVLAPGNRTYQVWYRNSAAFCTPDVFNLSNGLVVTWVP